MQRRTRNTLIAAGVLTAAAAAVAAAVLKKALDDRYEDYEAVDMSPAFAPTPGNRSEEIAYWSGRFYEILLSAPNRWPVDDKMCEFSVAYDRSGLVVKATIQTSKGAVVLQLNTGDESFKIVDFRGAGAPRPIALLECPTYAQFVDMAKV